MHCHFNNKIRPVWEGHFHSFRIQKQKNGLSNSWKWKKFLNCDTSCIKKVGTSWVHSRERLNLLLGVRNQHMDIDTLWSEIQINIHVLINRGPEASGFQKRCVWHKNAILNMARLRKNSGALPCMTFTEMASKGHNRHSKSLNIHS